jgi:GDP/UDP-N,N'-diacetylbacillosamine 2-epimerase (hydrolysing)
LIPQGCRSDIGLSAPVIKRLKKYFIVDTIQLSPQYFGQSYDWVERRLNLHTHMEPYDLVFITGDRVEMCAAAAAAFHNKVPIAHFYAGVVNDPITTFDDVDRHCITLWSDIQFCESEEADQNVCDILDCVPKSNNSYTVGISHLDDLEVDECMVPGEPYDLILVNFEPLQNKINWNYPVNSRFLIQIGENSDAHFGDIFGANVYYPNLPRPQFLGLLKNCQRFITNSSAAIYEAPHFLKPEQIVMVGDRNRNRPRGPFKTGASDRIVEILRDYLK